MDIENNQTNLVHLERVDKQATKDHNVNQTLLEESPNLSKRQLKKVKKREKWLERKTEKRLRERAKAREKRAHFRANNLDLGPSRKLLKGNTMANSTCKISVTIDLSFSDLMIDKDIAKLTKQILRCYTLNRRAAAPMQFSLTSFDGKSKIDIEKHNGYDNWDVKFHLEHYLNVYPKEKIIYLTSESENIIDNLEADCVYVIGGLVDHNSQKGLCHKLAVQAGVRHGRLPIDKFLKMKARKVLTVDHVFEILLRVTEGRTWQETFLQVLPERKNAKLILPEKEKTGDPDNLDVCNTEKMISKINGTQETEIHLDQTETDIVVHNETILQTKEECAVTL